MPREIDEDGDTHVTSDSGEELHLAEDALCSDNDLYQDQHGDPYNEEGERIGQYDP